MNKIFIAFSCVGLVGVSYVEAAEIQSFAVVRNGGGHLKAVVSRDSNGSLTMQTLSCSFRELSSAESLKTQVKLEGLIKESAKTILDNKALLASNQSIVDENLYGGSWEKLEITYDYTGADEQKYSQTKEIHAPVVIINKQMSPILSQLEAQARKASESICK